MDNVERRLFTFPSACGEGDIFARGFCPHNPKAIVQIAHGMSEHGGRYEKFASYLAINRYAVYLNDHLGHGGSAHGHPGTFSMKSGGFRYAREDMEQLFKIADQENPGRKHFLIGHSMGSILSGLFSNENRGNLSGLILIGTPAPNIGAAPGAFLARLIASVKGPTWQSALLNRISGGVISDSEEKDPIGMRSWLTHDIDVIKAFVEDPMCGFDFSASGSAELYSGLAAFGKKTWGKNIPKSLPVLISAGSDDSAGAYGKGPKHYYTQLVKYGVQDVTLKLLPGVRHEILNDNGREQTMEMLLLWLDEHVGDE